MIITPRFHSYGKSIICFRFVLVIKRRVFVCYLIYVFEINLQIILCIARPKLKRMSSPQALSGDPQLWGYGVKCSLQQGVPPDKMNLMGCLLCQSQKKSATIQNGHFVYNILLLLWLLDSLDPVTIKHQCKNHIAMKQI